MKKSITNVSNSNQPTLSLSHNSQLSQNELVRVGLGHGRSRPRHFRFPSPQPPPMSLLLRRPRLSPVFVFIFLEFFLVIVFHGWFGFCRLVRLGVAYGGRVGGDQCGDIHQRRLSSLRRFHGGSQWKGSENRNLLLHKGLTFSLSLFLELFSLLAKQGFSNLIFVKKNS